MRGESRRQKCRSCERKPAQGEGCEVGLCEVGLAISQGRGCEGLGGVIQKCVRKK